MTPSDTIAGITPTLCGLLGIAPPALSSAGAFARVLERISAQCGLARFDKCLVYAPDAIGTSFVASHPEIFAPVLDLAPVGAELRSVFPPKTPVCFASMFTGAPPEVHGIRRYERPMLACDTLFDALIRSGRRLAIAAVKGSSCDRVFRGRDIDYFSEEYDPQVTARALRLLEGDEHDFILAYHQEYDDSLHATTVGSDRSLTAARHHVASFVQLCAAAHDRWKGKGHLVVFAPDHGGHDDPVTGKGAHGEDIPEDMLVTHRFAARRGV